jgi:transposase
VLLRITWCAARTRNTYLAAQFRRFCRRFGKKGEAKAVFAVAHTMLEIAWHLLANGVDYEELGADYFDKRNDSAA